MLDPICDSAPFCISETYARAAQTVGMYVRVDENGQRIEASSEARDRLGVIIEWLTSDLFVVVPADRLRESCKLEACVAFRVSCVDLTCTWQATPLDDRPRPMLSEVRITATNDAAMEQAKANVFIGTSQGPISLSDLADNKPARLLAYAAPPTAAEANDPRRMRP